MRFSHIIPDADTVLALDPEELAGPLLVFLKREEQTPASNQLNRWTFTDGEAAMDGYPAGRHHHIRQALNEAWAWLEREGLLVLRPDANGRNGWYQLSRRAREFNSEIDVRAYQLEKRLPRERLHPRIAQKVWSSFIRGEYDTAVFQAFKEIEIGVRNAAGLPNELIGAALMRAAFNPKNGPLTEREADSGERVARMELFAGAIGAVKNPQSHRDVGAAADEAVELLFFATYLLRVVERRHAAR